MIVDNAADELPEHPEPLGLPNGVYLNLPEEDYHNATALGSGDIRRLAVSPPDFWFNSKLNPLWHPDDSDTAAKQVGTAAHVMVLYSRDEFNRRYGACDYPGNIKLGKAEREKIRDAGKIPLRRDDWDRLHQIGAIVRANPTLTNAFSGGAASEVSIFWTSNGIQKKCRIDYLKPRASVDLKTITNRREGMSFPQACRAAIAEYNYPVQAEHYREGREQMARLIEEGSVFVGGPSWRVPAEKPLAPKMIECALSKEFAFVIIFVQKTGAPLTWGCSLSRGNGVLDLARRTIERAEDHWRAYMERFGRDIPWILEEPLAELAVEELPQWWGR